MFDYSLLTYNCTLGNKMVNKGRVKGYEIEFCAKKVQLPPIGTLEGMAGAKNVRL